MTFSKEVLPENPSSNGAGETDDWGPYSVPSTSRRRTVPAEYQDICEFGYDIGLTGWKFLEIVRKNDAHFLVYWGDNSTPEKVRKITPREVAYVPETEKHLNGIFKGLSDLVGFSTGLSSRAETDLTFLAGELDRLIDLHNTIDSITGKLVPRFLVKRQEDGLLFLKERIFDVVELLMLNRAMGDELKESIKP
jgi:hypothetical protein